MKIKPIQLLLFSLLLTCSLQTYDHIFFNARFEKIFDPTSTVKEAVPPYALENTDEPSDSDGDGCTDDFDLCPQEASETGLVGCEPLSIYARTHEFTLRYHYPIDPSGRINVFGDRLLVLTNYELGEIGIYDLADGSPLRKIQIPDMLNDSPTLLPQGILLKNYDQQRWRLLDYNGKEIFSANEELEIINLPNNILVARADNTIFIRLLDDMKTIIEKLPGRYVSLSSDGLLAITDPDSCSVTLLDLANKQNNESFLFTPGSAVCYQSINFLQYQDYLYFINDGNTHFISRLNPGEEYINPGVLMEQIPAIYLLVGGNLLYEQNIPTGENTLLYDAGEKTIQKVTFSPPWDHINIQIQDPISRKTEIHFLNLETNHDYFEIQADHLLYLYPSDSYLSWALSEKEIQFYSLQHNEQIAVLETPPISNVQVEINQSFLLVSGQDHILYIYGPERK